MPWYARRVRRRPTSAPHAGLPAGWRSQWRPWAACARKSCWTPPTGARHWPRCCCRCSRACMPEALAFWRIATDTPDYTADDASGAGAERSGGRWNARGTPLLYASSTRALACLETVVHLGGGLALPLNRYLVRVDVPAEVWAARTIFDAAAHVGWDALPPGRVSIAWGTAWAQGSTSCVAEVPSVVV